MKNGGVIILFTLAGSFLTTSDAVSAPLPDSGMASDSLIRTDSVHYYTPKERSRIERTALYLPMKDLRPGEIGMFPKLYFLDTLGNGEGVLATVSDPQGWIEIFQSSKKLSDSKRRRYRYELQKAVILPSVFADSVGIQRELPGRSLLFEVIGTAEIILKGERWVLPDLAVISDSDARARLIQEGRYFERLLDAATLYETHSVDPKKRFELNLKLGLSSPVESFSFHWLGDDGREADLSCGVVQNRNGDYLCVFLREDGSAILPVMNRVFKERPRFRLYRETAEYRRIEEQRSRDRGYFSPFRTPPETRVLESADGQSYLLYQDQLKHLPLG